MFGAAFRRDFRRSMWAGLAAMLPIMLTVFIIWQLWAFVDVRVAGPINSVMKRAMTTYPGRVVLAKVFRWQMNGLTEKKLSEKAREDLKKKLDREFPTYVGVSMAVLLFFLFVYLVGSIIRSYLGKRTYRFTERLMARLPVIKSIYPAMKQVTFFLFSKKKQTKFRRVVAVEYPRKGIYVLAFVTGEGVRSVSNHAGRHMLNVFVPSSPTPFTGFVIFVAEEEAVALDMTVEEAVSMIMSGGVLVAPRLQAARTGEAALPLPDEEFDLTTEDMEPRQG